MQELFCRWSSEDLWCGIIAHPQGNIYWLLWHFGSPVWIFYLFDSELQTTFTLYTSAQSTFRKVLYKFDYSRLSEFVNKKIHTVNCFKMFIVEIFMIYFAKKILLLIRLEVGFSTGILVTVTEASSTNISLKNRNLVLVYTYYGGVP